MRFKHVFILMILILPMFVLAPTLVANQHETPMSPSKVVTSLPAEFVEETLRVAVYVESNMTLPAYATGGVYTSYYQNVIDLLESAGYAVTALSTQNILDHKLMVADYDAFVLPNQLPRESIINHIKDYWLGGGGILCFDAAVGYLFFAGIIDPSEEGQFNLYPIDASGLWTYAGLTGPALPYDGIYLNLRNPVTQSLEEDTVYPFTGNQTILGGFSLVSLLGDRFLELGYYNGTPTWTSIAGFDNPDRGGKIVYLTGNCSSFETWMQPVVVDSIDWLAPRPKARILFDLTHMPYYGVDLWDSDYVISPILHTDMRNFLVNHTYTFDKLYPSASGNLTTSNLASYDIVIVFEPYINFTAQEVADFTNWINSGGSILATTDHVAESSSNMNYLLSNTDIAVNLAIVGSNTLYTTGYHPIQEGCSTLSCLAPGSVVITGSAFSIWEDAIGIPVIGGDEHGDGRVILITDGAILRDGRIDAVDNAQALINFANWLSVDSTSVLVYTDGSAELIDPNYNYYKSPIATALNSLGVKFYLSNVGLYFNLSLNAQSWRLVIFDNNFYGMTGYHGELKDYLVSGGRMISRSFDLGNPSVLWDYVGVRGNQTSITTGPPMIYLWDTGHPIFNLPYDYATTTISTSNNNFNTDYRFVEPMDNATAIAGVSPTQGANNSAIILSNNGRAITNAFSISQYFDDTDNSTYSDSVEIYVNEIAFLYFNRPTIDSPADVTYMETETGNEITWTPTADAGPWEYVLRVNGSIETTVHWTGGTITINVDGITASITEYELTVYDRLGYSVSDLVVLNVTEYVAPPPGGGGIDPLILIAVGAGIAVVVVIIIIVMQKNKKK